MTWHETLGWNHWVLDSATCRTRPSHSMVGLVVHNWERSLGLCSVSFVDTILRLIIPHITYSKFKTIHYPRAETKECHLGGSCHDVSGCPTTDEE